MPRPSRLIPPATLAAALIVIGAAGDCSASTGAFVLAGTYQLVSADGRPLPVRFDTLDATLPRAMIRGGTLEVQPSDTMWLTTQLELMDGAGHVVDTLPDERGSYLYTQVGDSLYYQGTSGAVPFGKIVGSQLHLRVSYPAPPSEGIPGIVHDLDFEK
ncbi:MAG TPA: hypothetical protein VMT93_08425 [Gemmatimonadaceae bacterium]|nr:hypothetical protein [Gemmatimonadaceae bacterium]